MPKEKDISYNILIIDDDAFLLDMYSLKFSQKNFSVTTSSGTIDALEKLRGGYVPDVMVVDLVMPTMDGFEFLEQVKKEELIPDALVMILSNLGQQEDIDRGKSLGAAGFIIKASATPSEVVDKVLDAIEKNKK
ncbi:MAG: hypothetical protein A2494_03925 [Candidatus Lloydbacteria bacterium RIFOXYC12_FULL_46_25]|uniref:Response regulatory domain-containing protein n=1 Tax=Candidatus Lloydbacteria bacterium RIFOXYC12_FULL_46_25 TaxID=1798670 RepID=A0A1G2DXC0_9BACT|nr:MAG: hypothetical protein A2494_03925 [Candidatus Lloydbacteria bacterium RIFOXYC12_FULL_46_25]